jgi:hypothetical protein
MANDNNNPADKQSHFPASWKSTAQRAKATFWQQLYRVQTKSMQLRMRHRRALYFGAALCLVTVTLLLSGPLNAWLQSNFTTDKDLDSFRSLILNLGSALIGATAIVASLVLFALQVNIERMPHGLFRRLTGDWRLLGAFALALLVAIGVACLSAFLSANKLALATHAATWGVLIILWLFLYSYRRALSLINPVHQLQLLVYETQRHLNRWVKRFNRLAPLLKPADGERIENLDIERHRFFQVNSHWNTGARQALMHAMSFTSRYAEQGDHEVSAAALSAVIRINAAYVAAKGRTFFANSPFIDNPHATDSFINDTLEALRMNIQAAVGRRDEQQIEQGFRAMTALVKVYLNITYPGLDALKDHARLAAHYLTGAVEGVVPHDMVDVLLEGERQIGDTAINLLHHDDPQAIIYPCEKLAIIAASGCAKEHSRAITMEGMRQLSRINFEMLRCSKRDIQFLARQLRTHITSVATVILLVPEANLSRIHSVCLGPYYSPTNTESLYNRLASLVNELADAEPDNEDAKTCLSHVEQWVADSYDNYKPLLLQAASAHSSFAFDMIQWLAGIAEMMMALSKGPACEHYLQEKFWTHAQWLLGTLTFIPDDQETIRFVESHQLTDVLYGAVRAAYGRECDPVAENAERYLLSWSFKAGKYETGSDTLSRGLSALAVVAVQRGQLHCRRLKADIKTRLFEKSKPSTEMLNRAAETIAQTAKQLGRHDYTFRSRIDTAIARADPTHLRPLLEDIVQILTASDETQ